jgi:hypothetical protein
LKVVYLALGNISKEVEFAERRNISSYPKITKVISEPYIAILIMVRHKVSGFREQGTGNKEFK